MLKDILEFEGAQELSKKEQESVNGGEKCRSWGTENWCFTQCRPSFLGIGFGSWGPYEIENSPC